MASFKSFLLVFLDFFGFGWLSVKFAATMDILLNPDSILKVSDVGLTQYQQNVKFIVNLTLGTVSGLLVIAYGALRLYILWKSHKSGNKINIDDK